ncbi:hypothetical protein ABT354_34970 [Streptomyces sp. NPDC000594]|uniref:hypothetical protein n=1 Tax=Streptomyces sp. NPDC000594 TaxID=3154261 RepID=UPI003324CEDB
MRRSDSEFLIRAAENAFELGERGHRVTLVEIPSQRVTAVDTGCPPEPPVYIQGEPFLPGTEGRRGFDWTPAPEAPSWMQLAWLLKDLGEWLSMLAEAQVTVEGLESPLADWCDVRVRDGDTRLRVRIALSGRTDALDFPGMYLHDLFREGRSQAHLVPGRAPADRLMDLRDVL